MIVVPSVDDRVLYRSLEEPQVLRAADVTAVLPPVEGVEHVSLIVFDSWPADYEQSHNVSDSPQADGNLELQDIPPGTWRSIVDIPGWRGKIGT